MGGNGSVGGRAAGAAAGTLRRSLWYVEPGRMDLRAERITPPGPGEVLVRTLWSGVSRGTERLVLEGRVPSSEFVRMRAPRQEGAFPFPVKYGYAAVGRVVAGPDELRGRAVFCLNPHDEMFVAPAAAVVPVPDVVPTRRAVLAANMETALNAVWDGGVGPGDRVVVVGAGVVGLLTARLAAAIPATTVSIVDSDPRRGAVAGALGLAFAEAVRGDEAADVVFHASASGAGLGAAMTAAGFEARVVEMSWHGEGAVPLGGAFHSQRLTLVSSQVGAVAAGRRARVTSRRRLETALALLADDRLDALIEAEVPFEAAADLLPRLLSTAGAAAGIVLRYADDGDDSPVTRG